MDAKPFYNYLDGKPTTEQAGMKLECVITKDDTVYNNQEITNEYEKIRLKFLELIKLESREVQNLKLKELLKCGVTFLKTYLLNQLTCK